MTAISLLAGLLILGLVLGFGPTVTRKYDEKHRVSIECMVTGAEADKGSASGRGSASWSQVVIRTSDCGTLLLTSGVNSSNREEVAAELAEGGKFRIEVGAFEQATSWVNNLLGLSPRAWSFEKID
ncbi:hypothetical protein ACWGQ2_08795 [Arthrobacter sp. NPDC055585]